MPNIEFRKFDSLTLNDARSVVERIFGAKAFESVELGLRNPNRKMVSEAGSGEVVYEDGVAIGFHAAYPRIMYFRQAPFVYISGSTLGVLPSAKTGNIAMQILKRTQFSPRAGSKMFVGNTINSSRVKLNALFRIKGVGPMSCAEKRIAVLNWMGFLLYLVRTKVLKRHNARRKTFVGNGDFRCEIGGVRIRRLYAIDVALFDDFFARYLSLNKGVVASRTAEELRWLFGDKLDGKQVLLVGAFDAEKLVGYAFIGCDQDEGVATIKDLIVMENNVNLLGALLEGVIKMLRKTTNCFLCYISGYPDFAQPAIRKAFKIARRLGNNQFCYSFQKSNPVDFPIEILNTNQSWFFGAYDGDACML